jgi:hypothetical protein
MTRWSKVKRQRQDGPHHHLAVAHDGAVLDPPDTEDGHLGVPDERGVQPPAGAPTLVIVNVPSCSRPA